MDEPLVKFLVLLIWLPLCVVVGRMAVSYRRSPMAWFFLALVFSPVVAFVFLIVADVPHSAVALQEKEEQARQRHPEISDVREVVLSETKCPHCGAVVNPATREGLHSPETEPWLLICNQCQTTIQPDA